jgi:hypothetical protein
MMNSGAYNSLILYTEVVWTSPFGATKMFSKMLIWPVYVA